jgi:hypothetical protein
MVRAMPSESCLMKILEIDHSSSAIDGEGARMPETTAGHS